MTMIEKLKAFRDQMTRIAERAQALAPQRPRLSVPDRQNQIWDALDGAHVACKDVASAIQAILPFLEKGKIRREAFPGEIRSYLKSAYDFAVKDRYRSSIAAAKVRVYTTLFKRLEMLTQPEEE
jgi:hypothetical protein